MIILYDNGDGRGTRVDREILSELTGRSIRTIREHCEVIDRRNGRALYRLKDALTILEKVPQRAPRRTDGRRRQSA